MRRRRGHPDRHSNHFQRVHEHSTRGAERPDPDDCACGGGGWILSSCDVWEKCHKHYDGQEHPEHRTSPREKRRRHELYVQRCREERIDDPEAAHEAALKEHARREAEREVEDVFGPPSEPGGDEQDEDGPELPF